MKEEKEKILKIQWKHRNSKEEKFYYFAQPDGGSKPLVLIEGKHYDLDTIIQLSRKVFYNERTRNYFDYSELEFGHAGSEIRLKSFGKSTDGTDLGLWDIVSAASSSSAKRCSLAIFTTYVGPLNESMPLQVTNNISSARGKDQNHEAVPSNEFCLHEKKTDCPGSSVF